MINLEIELADGTKVMIYDVYPRSQAQAIPLPAGAVAILVWLGTR
jgi:hypothetical protein